MSIYKWDYQMDHQRHSVNTSVRFLTRHRTHKRRIPPIPQQNDHVTHGIVNSIPEGEQSATTGLTLLKGISSLSVYRPSTMDGRKDK
jgi:hypothetical protein